MKLIKKYFPELTEKQLEQLFSLQPIYEEWNARINVISRKDLSHLYERHILHALSIAKITPFLPGEKVMDLGTGGGLPGIPLAIVFPEVHFHLVDSVGKKLKVVNAAKEALNLNNVTSEHNRAEKLQHPPFDFVVTRAVAPLKKLGRWSMSLIKKDRGSHKRGGLICLKGGDLADEISESGYHPYIYHLKDFFEEDFYLTKSLLLIKK